MKNFMKKNWFVCLLAVLFVVASTYYIYDTNKGKLKGKTSNGEDVVYEINGNDITASQFYDTLYETAGPSALYHAVTKAVAATVETTDEMKQTASAQASQIVSNYSQSYSTDYKEQIGSELQSLGYSGYEDLETYLIDSLKLSSFSAEYAKNHFDDLQIRSISYLLIQPSTSTTGTGGTTETVERSEEEIQEIKDNVDKALADGTSFADVASQYSDDSSTASSGGYLGVIDTNTSNLDEAFFTAAMALADGEVSDWVHSDQFGDFKILCNACTPETFEQYYVDQNTTEDTTTEVDPMDAYEQLVSTYDTTLTNKAVYAKAVELGMSFADETAESSLKQYMGITE